MSASELPELVQEKLTIMLLLEKFTYTPAQQKSEKTVVWKEFFSEIGNEQPGSMIAKYNTDEIYTAIANHLNKECNLNYKEQKLQQLKLQVKTTMKQYARMSVQQEVQATGASDDEDLRRAIEASKSIAETEAKKRAQLEQQEIDEAIKNSLKPGFLDVAEHAKKFHTASDDTFDPYKNKNPDVNTTVPKGWGNALKQHVSPRKKP